MKWPPYPKYKNSRVEWLGDVPEHWRHACLRWLSRIYSGGTPDKSNPDFWSDGTIPWLNSGAVNQNEITEPSGFITEEGFSSSSTRWIPPYALLMALAGQGKTKGMVAQLMFEATCNQSMAAIIPASTLSSRYLYWWLTSNYRNIRNLSGGDNRDGLNLVLLGNIRCPIPNQYEQQAIAAFLDKETGRIDTLIAKKKALIEKLKEQRTAIISNAVTKGLPAEVAPRYGFTSHTRFKPSGIDWLGDVPEGWDIVKVGTGFQVTLGKMLQPDPQSLNDIRIPYLRAINVQWEAVVNEVAEMWCSESDVKKYAVQKGDLLVCEGGEVGRAAIQKREDSVCILQNALHRVRAHDGYEVNFLLRILQHVSSSGWLSVICNKATIAHFTRDKFVSLALPVPPIEEQQAIAAYLDEQTGKIDALIAKLEQAITTLQEYRTALITAAVTGKIDVRHEAGMQEIS